MKLVKYAVRVIVALLTIIAVAAGVLYAAMWIVVNGPSESAGRLFVLSVRETSAVGFLADWFMTDEQIAALYKTADADDYTEVDPSLVHISKKSKKTTDTDETDPGGTETAGDTQTDEPVDGNDGVRVISVSGKTFNGKLIFVDDPTRVFVGTPDKYGEKCKGLTVMSMVEKYDALVGINAGGFVDPDGKGTGGLPEGLVISGGKLLWGSKAATYSIAGFDSDGRFYAGYMTGERALSLGISEAVSFGPPLIINGVPCNSNYRLGGGLNPRTAIGQRADGTVMLLVINGRFADSIGATYDDLADVMMQYGAVNAANLDGGSSSLMIYDGEYITKSAYVLGERVVATSFLVRR